MRHSKVLKHLDVVLGAVSPLRLPSWRVKRPHKGNKLVGNDPIQVSILNFLVVLVFLIVKVAEAVPAETDSELEPLQAVEDSALISARITVASISEGPKLVMVRRESFPDDFGLLLQNHDHEGAHQVGGIDILVVLSRAVVEQLDVLVAFVGQETAQFTDVLVRVRNVQGAKIRVERFVH